MTLRIGIDFDNTIVNYDGLFSKVAKKLELKLDSYPSKKESINITTMNYPTIASCR